MRSCNYELGIDKAKPESLTGYVLQEYQGSRYAFGYTACPDLDAHKPLFRIERTTKCVLA